MTSTDDPHSLPLPFHDLASCIAFVEKHRHLVDSDADNVVEQYTAWKSWRDKDGAVHAEMVYDLSIVCAGHYAFEEEGSDLTALWTKAGECYADGTYRYPNSGCDGSCVTAHSDPHEVQS